MNNYSQRVRPFIILLPLLYGITLVSGCSTVQPMALQPKTANLDLESKSTGLFTLRTSNEYRPSFQPEVHTLEVISEETKKTTVFSTQKPHSQEKNTFKEYLISLSLEPGIHRLGKVNGGSNNVLVIGSFSFSVGASFNLPPNSIVYLGHIEMKNRKRRSNEPRSGSIFPLIDQSASGFGDGTFDISVSDRSTMDMQFFKQAYPILANQIITKSIMDL